MLRLLEGHGEIRHAALESLTAHDAEQGTRLADSLLRYLDAFGDVTGAARTLNIHPNTLRYRVRRAAALTGLDLDDPEHRLAAMLQLRLGRDGGAAPSDPFPVGRDRGCGPGVRPFSARALPADALGLVEDGSSTGTDEDCDGDGFPVRGTRGPAR
ncbi:PucR family transcriptional regulator [Streptomyces sp. NPDC001914]|uniref:PucR family transcriptional regulator n=1 Tax=Streptomyces sp. NPDC001914 TaxID=3364623 RepID=UPI0036BBCF2A